MPLTVRAWPDSTDPRGSHFSIRGYGFGAVPPNKFSLITTGALAPYDYLNAGILIPVLSETEAITTYGDLGVGIQLQKRGFVAVQPSPEDHTVRWILDIQTPTFPLYSGERFFESPYGITQFDIDVTTLGVPDDLIPNPVTVRPRNHLATS